MFKKILKELVKYIVNLLLALDCMVNAILFGDPQETISSRVGKMVYMYDIKAPPILFLFKALDKIDPGHCVKSIDMEEGDRNINFKL